MANRIGWFKLLAAASLLSGCAATSDPAPERAGITVPPERDAASVADAIRAADARIAQMEAAQRGVEQPRGGEDGDVAAAPSGDPAPGERMGRGGGGHAEAGASPGKPKKPKKPGKKPRGGEGSSDGDVAQRGGERAEQGSGTLARADTGAPAEKPGKPKKPKKPAKKPRGGEGGSDGDVAQRGGERAEQGSGALARADTGAAAEKPKKPKKPKKPGKKPRGGDGSSDGDAAQGGGERAEPGGGALARADTGGSAGKPKKPGKKPRGGEGSSDGDVAHRGGERAEPGGGALARADTGAPGGKPPKPKRKPRGSAGGAGSAGSADGGALADASGRTAGRPPAGGSGSSRRDTGSGVTSGGGTPPGRETGSGGRLSSRRSSGGASGGVDASRGAAAPMDRGPGRSGGSALRGGPPAAGGTTRSDGAPSVGGGTRRHTTPSAFSGGDAASGGSAGSEEAVIARGTPPSSRGDGSRSDGSRGGGAARSGTGASGDDVVRGGGSASARRGGGRRDDTAAAGGAASSRPGAGRRGGAGSTASGGRDYTPLTTDASQVARIEWGEVRLRDGRDGVLWSGARADGAATGTEVLPTGTAQHWRGAAGDETAVKDPLNVRGREFQTEWNGIPFHVGRDGRVTYLYRPDFRVGMVANAPDKEYRALGVNTGDWYIVCKKKQAECRMRVSFRDDASGVFRTALLFLYTAPGGRKQFRVCVGEGDPEAAPVRVSVDRRLDHDAASAACFPVEESDTIVRELNRGRVVVFEARGGTHAGNTGWLSTYGIDVAMELMALLHERMTGG